MPVTKENLQESMTYHKLDEDQQRRYIAIEHAAIKFAEVILNVLPDTSDDQQAAIRHIFEAKATANRGVAIRGIV
jgi:hypothetical protein